MSAQRVGASAVRTLRQATTASATGSSSRVSSQRGAASVVQHICGHLLLPLYALKRSSSAMLTTSRGSSGSPLALLGLYRIEAAIDSVFIFTTTTLCCTSIARLSNPHERALPRQSRLRPLRSPTALRSSTTSIRCRGGAAPPRRSSYKSYTRAFRPGRSSKGAEP